MKEKQKETIKQRPYPDFEQDVDTRGYSCYNYKIKFRVILKNQNR